MAGDAGLGEGDEEVGPVLSGRGCSSASPTVDLVQIVVDGEEYEIGHRTLHCQRGAVARDGIARRRDTGDGAIHVKKLIATLSLVATLLAGCAPPAPVGPIETAAPGPTLIVPTVIGGDPSPRVAAFYYPWYGNPTVNGAWSHWEGPGFNPPRSISSDYFPQLGPYSSTDPTVVAQHMAWLRQAGVGVIITSWWGPGSFTDRAVPLLLETAHRYGIKVAFHIEPYGGRTFKTLVDDIRYLYERYGSSPAFFRSRATSRYSPSSEPKGMFFVFCVGFEGNCDSGTPVRAEYWKAATDAIHGLPEGALMIGASQRSNVVLDGHFDGLYNYITLDLAADGGFSWARDLPPQALYVPSVIPGNSAQRIGYAPRTLVKRHDGQTYYEQWTAALGAGVRPELVTITSFNEWHEGSMIEPIALGATDGAGYDYADFGAIVPDGYLELTRRWAQTFQATVWPATYRVRLRITTTSDWTTVQARSGGAWQRPEQVSASPTATMAGLDAQGRVVLMQPLAEATVGNSVAVTYDVLFTGLSAGTSLVFTIDRGNIGATTLTVFNMLGADPVEVLTTTWSGVTTGRNSHDVPVAASSLRSP